MSQSAWALPTDIWLQSLGHKRVCVQKREADTRKEELKSQNYYGRAIKGNADDIEVAKKGFLPSCCICYHLMRIQCMFIALQLRGLEAFGSVHVQKK